WPICLSRAGIYCAARRHRVARYAPAHHTDNPIPPKSAISHNPIADCRGFRFPFAIANPLFRPSLKLSVQLRRQRLYDATDRTLVVQSAAIGQFAVEQIVATAGSGDLRDESECSQELRRYLTEVPSSKLAEYVDRCLTTHFPKSGMV